MTHSLDNRTSPYRDDLAAKHLSDVVTAPRYTTGTTQQVLSPLAPLYAMPDDNTPTTSTLLYGEKFIVYDQQDGWAWGQCEHDDYVGYLREEHLRTDTSPASHYVSALSTYLFSSPDVKSPPYHPIYFMSPVCIDTDTTQPTENGFIAVKGGGWVYAEHISRDYGTDHTAEALKFLYTPYLWGGRSHAGLDCSALVQISLAATGRAAPRDSDMLEAILGTPLDGEDVPEKGDLAFFPGHVGIMLDDMHLLHANATHMRVSIDPLKDVIGWIERESGHGLNCIRRLAPAGF